MPQSPRTQNRNMENHPAHIAGQDVDMGTHPGPEEFFPSFAGTPQIATVDANLHPREHIPTGGDAIRLGTEPLVVQQNDQTCSSLAEHETVGPQLVRGRHHVTRDNQARDRSQSSGTDQHVDPFGSQGEEREEHASSSSTIPILRTRVQPSDKHHSSHPNQTETDRENDQTSTEETARPTKEHSTTSRELAGQQQVEISSPRPSTATHATCSPKCASERDQTGEMAEAQVLEHGNVQTTLATTSASKGTPRNSAPSAKGPPTLKRLGVHSEHRCKQPSMLS